MIKHSQPMRKLRTARLQIWVAVMLSTNIPCSALAGITTDTSLGHASQTLAGNMTIPQSMGLLSGNNLFHSFLTFNINTGESTNFTTSTNGIANVISRVTGGSLSQINGQLSLTPCGGCSAPNFFFINPAGVTFGAGASVNVPGAFHVSTADYVKFPDGNYYADLSKASTFSVAPPETFGFLGNSRASITVNGGAILTTQPEKPISVVAGDITLDSGTVSTLSGGDIRVVTVGQTAVEVPFTGPLPAANGNLNISNGGNITTDTSTTASAGSIYVSAGNISIDGIVLDTTGGLIPWGRPCFYNCISGKGYGGISSNTSKPGNTGNAGNVTISVANNLSILHGGAIASKTSSSGNAATITVNAGSLTIDGIGINTGITSNADAGSRGNSGNITITAPGSLSVFNAGQISSSTSGSGKAGAVRVGAGTLLIDGTVSGGFDTGIFTSAKVGSSGQTGDVTVTAIQGISLLNSGQIFIGNEATIANPMILTPTSVKVTAPILSSDNPSNIASTSTGNINPASLSISVPSSNYGSSIVTDNSFGQPSQTLLGPNYVIPQLLGLLSGNNLFQSFQTFGLNTGESATFSTSSSGIANLISRVTGGEQSYINGKITLAPCNGCGSPNFFFINPMGVTFGAGASVNVPGAFHVSTADYIKFLDGNFYADPNQSSTYSAALPEAFGFLGASRASIVVNGGATIQSLPTQPISIVAGDVTIDNGILSTLNGGDIRVVAIGQTAQEISFTGALPTANGNLTIANGGIINADTTSTATTGSVYVSGGNIVIDGKDGSLIAGILSGSSTPNNTGNAGSITLSASDNLSIIGARISSSTQGQGDSGQVTVNAGSANIEGAITSFAGIGSGQTDTGNAGNINVTTSTGDISIGKYGDIGSYGSANSGVINLTASGNLSITNGGVVTASTSGLGNAGTINLTTSGNLSITNGGQVSTLSDIFINGNAGAINLTTSGNLSINDGFINSYTKGYGNAGTINLSTSGNLSITNGGQISVSTSSLGNAGTVNITTSGTLSINNGSSISSRSYYGSGNAGNVKIRAGTVLVDGVNSAINAMADYGSYGHAGNIFVNADDSISISNGGQLSIQNNSTAVNPSLLTPTSITLTSPVIKIQNSSNAITTSSTGNADAGSVKITASTSLYLDPSGITTTANWGNGGSIDISASRISLDNSQISSVSTNGNGGNININASTLLLNTGYIMAFAPTGLSGGNISINVPSILADGGTLFLGQTNIPFQPGIFGLNVIQATGVVRTSSPTLDLSSSLSGLNTQQIDTGGLGRSPCQTTGGSSLAPSGRGGLSRGLLRAELPMPSTISGNASPNSKVDIRFAMSDWSCS